MKISPKQIIIVLAAVIVVVLLILLFSGSKPPSPPKVTLNIWGVFEEREALERIVSNYQQVRPNVEVKYQKIDGDNYQTALLDALAAGRGPDIFAIHNRSLPKNLNKLAPASLEQINLTELRELFPQVVEQDFTNNNKIYALPLYLDTLVLIYNKDLFDQAGIVSPPKTWDEFQNIVPRLRLLGEGGRIERAAAAIGSSEKTTNAGIDLLHLLMTQNGAKMVNPELTAATFAEPPGFQAFNFYLQFANPQSSLYTWNDNQLSALDSFASGNVAMIFGYKSDVATIKRKNPFLNFGIAPAPQPTGSQKTLSYADYWGFAVSKQSKNSDWAWGFIVNLTTNSQNEKIYLEASKEPAALLSIIAERMNDPDLGVFAKQALTARSWHEADEEKTKEIFNAAIISVLNGKTDSERALRQAQDQVSLLMRK
jgi:ABC-type glycerol-3-phosphate transport system substrate-binding protein